MILIFELCNFLNYIVVCVFCHHHHSTSFISWFFSIIIVFFFTASEPVWVIRLVSKMTGHLIFRFFGRVWRLDRVQIGRCEWYYHWWLWCWLLFCVCIFGFCFSLNLDDRFLLLVILNCLWLRNRLLFSFDILASTGLCHLNWWSFTTFSNLFLVILLLFCLCILIGHWLPRWFKHWTFSFLFGWALCGCTWLLN